MRRLAAATATTITWRRFVRESFIPTIRVMQVISNTESKHGTTTTPAAIRWTYYKPE